MCAHREHRTGNCSVCRLEAATDKAVAAIERMTPEQAREVRDVMRGAVPQLWDGDNA